MQRFVSFLFSDVDDIQSCCIILNTDDMYWTGFFVLLGSLGESWGLKLVFLVCSGEGLLAEILGRNGVCRS